ncbi:MAG: ABC transporter substrate-binding protein [Allorhizobium sp.]
MSADVSAAALSRRALLSALAAGMTCRALPALAATPLRIVSLDYGLASTLLSLGVVPVAVASLADWAKWVVEPAMPASVIDLGSSWEVNFEILAQLKPDLILSTPYLDALQPRLETVAPVLRISVFSAEGGDILPKAIAATETLGREIGRGTQASAFLTSADALFDDCRARLAPLSPPPVALINFMDARHARIYGAPGIYDNVLARIGVENAWKENSNYWGFQTIGIEDLSRVTNPRTRLIAFEPVPGDVLQKLSHSPLWQALPFARPGHFAVLPGALMFGMVNEAMRFARLITDYLEASR